MNAWSRILPMLIVSITAACNGSLSEDQRKAFREEMEDREIKKVNENEIFRKALEIGREISAKEVAPSDVRMFSASLRDSLMLNETEQKITMAYAYAPDPTQVEDNIQKQGPDSLIYSKYILDQDSTGRVLFIKMARSKVVKVL
ncbi:MAG: hypothetical protein AAGG59_15610 [Bacteroidota bacterium]